MLKTPEISLFEYLSGNIKEDSWVNKCQTIINQFGHLVITDHFISPKLYGHATNWIHEFIHKNPAPSDTSRLFTKSFSGSSNQLQENISEGIMADLIFKFNKTHACMTKLLPSYKNSEQLSTLFIDQITSSQDFISYRTNTKSQGYYFFYNFRHNYCIFTDNAKHNIIAPHGSLIYIPNQLDTEIQLTKDGKFSLENYSIGISI